MIRIEEIPVARIDEFWNLHLAYLKEDEIVTDEEDLAYFSDAEYRDVIKAHMQRKKDKHHMVYFVENYKCYNKNVRNRSFKNVHM